MSDLPTVQELSDIQTEWMNLQHTAPLAEQQRVFKLMERLPKIYVSGHDGKGVCIASGGPMSVSIDFALAMDTCRKLGGRTDVAWNGQLGKWYDVNPNAVTTQAFPKGRW